MTPEESALVPTERHVDYSVFGTVPLEIAIETKEQKYLTWARPSPTAVERPHAGWADQRVPLLDRRHVT